MLPSILSYYKGGRNKKQKLVNIACFIRTNTTKKALILYITE